MYIKIIILIALLIIFLVWLGITTTKKKWLSQIYDDIISAMKEAEKKYPSGHGEEKKEFVLNSIKQKCEELEIPYAKIFHILEKLIEKIIYYFNAMTK